MRKVKKMESNAYSLSSFEEMMISLYLDSTDSHLVKNPELTLVRMWVRPGKLEGMFKVGKVSTVSGEILEFESEGEMESFRGVDCCFVREKDRMSYEKGSVFGPEADRIDIFLKP